MRTLPTPILDRVGHDLIKWARCNTQPSIPVDEQVIERICSVLGLRLIGTCEPTEVKSLEALPKLRGQFDIIYLANGDRPDINERVQYEVNELEDFHLCVFDSSSLATAVKICEKFWPDKVTLHEAVSLLDQTAAEIELQAHSSANQESSEKVAAFDRQLRSVIHSRLICHEEGDFRRMQEFDVNYDELLEKRVELKPLRQIFSSHFVATFCRESRLDEAQVNQELRE